MSKLETFIAIDFETANNKPDSACAVGMARIENNRVVDTFSALIKPPSNNFMFTYIHGITWEDVAEADNFAQVWTRAQNFIADTQAFIAHNASFDRNVLHTCCNYYLIEPPSQKFICTLKASRKCLKLPSHALNALCQHFDIPLNHHEAESDAIGAAQIFLTLCQMGLKPQDGLIR